MKLKAYAIRDAARRRDAAEILGIFAETFPEVADMANKQWRIMIAPFDPSGVMRLVTPTGTFGWNGAWHFIDARMNDNYVIRFSEDFYNSVD